MHPANMICRLVGNGCSDRVTGQQIEATQPTWIGEVCLRIPLRLHYLVLAQTGATLQAATYERRTRSSSKEIVSRRKRRKNSRLMSFSVQPLVIFTPKIFFNSAAFSASS